MEVIHGSILDLKQAAVTGAVPTDVSSKDELEQQAMLDAKIRLEALTALLIEKGLITRDELVSMIHQKKMGL